MRRVVVFASPLTVQYEQELGRCVNYGWDAYTDPDVLRFARDSLLYHAWEEFSSSCTLEQWSPDDCPFVQPELFPELLKLLDSLLCEITLLLQKPELSGLVVKEFEVFPGGVTRIALIDSPMQPIRRNHHGASYQRRPTYWQSR